MRQGATGDITGGTDVHTAEGRQPLPHTPAAPLGAADVTAEPVRLRRHVTRIVGLDNSPALFGEFDLWDVGRVCGVSSRRRADHGVGDERTVVLVDPQSPAERGAARCGQSVRSQLRQPMPMGVAAAVLPRSSPSA